MEYYTSEDPEKIKELEKLEKGERLKKIEADRLLRLD